MEYRVIDYKKRANFLSEIKILRPPELHIAWKTTDVGQDCCFIIGLGILEVEGEAWKLFSSNSWHIDYL